MVAVADYVVEKRPGGRNAPEQQDPPTWKPSVGPSEHQPRLL